MKNYIFDVKYRDPVKTHTMEKRIAIPAAGYLQAWIGCVEYMWEFLGTDLYRVDEIGLITIEEL